MTQSINPIPIKPTPLTRTAFAPFGDVLDATPPADMIINQGLCGRYHDQAKLDFDFNSDSDTHSGEGGGRAGVSVFLAEPRTLPYRLDLMERHPLGSQCFMPMTENPFLAITALDDNGHPARPQAFIVPPHTGINFHRNIWHGVLTPLHAPGLFAVIDRIGEGHNLEEAPLNPPYIIEY